MKRKCTKKNIIVNGKWGWIIKVSSKCIIVCYISGKDNDDSNENGALNYIIILLIMAFQCMCICI